MWPYNEKIKHEEKRKRKRKKAVWLYMHSRLIQAKERKHPKTGNQCNWCKLSMLYQTVNSSAVTESTPGAGHEDWLLCQHGPGSQWRPWQVHQCVHCDIQPHGQGSTAVLCFTHVPVLGQPAGRSGVGYTDQMNFQGMHMPVLLIDCL